MDNPLSYLNYSKFMQDAIIAALNTKAFPNPKVAAVLTDKKGNIKSTGVHHGPGTNHAEIDLLSKTTIDKDDILYVTLEPCFHADSSPSCAVELMNTSLQNIVIGDIDVDPRTNGKSIELFKKKGLNIEFEYNANNLINPHYSNQKIKEGSNTVIGKIASSQNNYIYNNRTEDKYISNEISLALTHILRASVDAIAIGKNTLLIDNPKLDVRKVNIKDSDPIKIVFWGTDPNIDPHLLKHSDIYFLTSFTHKTDKVIPILNGDFDMKKLFKNLNINSLLIEGGNYLHKYFTANSLYDKFYWFKSTDKIHSGIKFSDEVVDSLRNKYQPINKFLLKDNQLTTYTYM